MSALVKVRRPMIFGKPLSGQALLEWHLRCAWNDLANSVRCGRRTREETRLLQTPKWANKKAIAAFYAATPAGLTVDHVIPLRGYFVSGLHVENNLQYLSKSENGKKGRFYNVDATAPKRKNSD